jgi:CheY-like chemotaxis protein
VAGASHVYMSAPIERINENGVSEGIASARADGSVSSGESTGAWKARSDFRCLACAVRLIDALLAGELCWLVRINSGFGYFGGPRLSITLIAVVEDDPRVLASLETLLESAGYTVLLFSSAEELLSSEHLPAVDCLLSDIGLPGMTGTDLLRNLRSRGVTVPTILITARQDGSVQKALEAGARHVFLKPFDSAELLKAIAAL